MKIAQDRPAQAIALWAYTADRPGAVPERSYCMSPLISGKVQS
jgi:hypothetical protein